MRRSHDGLHCSSAPPLLCSMFVCCFIVWTPVAGRPTHVFLLRQTWRARGGARPSASPSPTDGNRAVAGVGTRPPSPYNLSLLPPPAYGRRGRTRVTGWCAGPVRGGPAPIQGSGGTHRPRQSSPTSTSTMGRRLFEPRGCAGAPPQPGFPLATPVEAPQRGPGGDAAAASPPTPPGTPTTTCGHAKWVTITTAHRAVGICGVGGSLRQCSIHPRE